MNIEQYYELYSDKIYAFIYYAVGNKETAEDLTQETFLKAMKQLNGFRGEATVKTWLLTIARNTVTDHIRRGKKISFLPFLKKNEEIDYTYVPETWLQNKEQQRELYEALGALKHHYREAIILRKIEQYSIKDTAAILGCSESQVKNNTERGMKALANLLGGDLDEFR